ncbi:MAG TPA: glycerophosphodiester phosphodiesterase family protein [Verrucomicrobiae bacterium]
MSQKIGRWHLFALVFLPFTTVCLGASPVLSIGHRGSSLFAPENTIAAYTAARGKADLVEADARLSADGKLVIMHDATVDRTTDGTGTVASKTVAQLKLLDAGSWFSAAFVGERVPTLEDMLTNTLSHASVLIEQKDGPASVYVDELRRLGAVTNVILQSFDWNFLAAAHALEPVLRLGTLGSTTLNATTLTSISNSGARIVAWEKSMVTSNEVNLVHSAGLALYVWTVDGAEIRHFIDLGVDGIISNDPDLVRRLQQPATNAPAELGDGLVAYWKMDDGLADAFAVTVADSKGTNAGTLVRNDGASHWFNSPMARMGGCLKLEGTSAFVTLPQTAALDINTNQITFSAWVRLSVLPSQLTTSYGAIYDSTTDCYVLYLDKSNKELRFKVTDRNGQAARPGIPEAWLVTNQWLHIAATFSGTVGPVSGQATIYLNGQPRDVHTGSDSTSPVGLTSGVKPGQQAAMGREGPTGGNYFTGYIDDVAVWRRSLSPADVAALYEAGQSGLSLGDLLRTPTPLIQMRSLRLLSSSAQLELEFASLGPWTAFRLLQANDPFGQFLAVPGLTAEALGGSLYRFVYPLETNSQAFFRVEGN